MAVMYFRLAKLSKLKECTGSSVLTGFLMGFNG